MNPASPPRSAGERMALACEGLLLSRQHLRQALQGPPVAAAAPQGASALPWLDKLRAIPAVGVVIDAVRSWWAQHPWRVVGLVAAGATKAVVQPVAQRHPLALVAGALAVGAVFAWTRPWRWALKPALFAGLLPQLFSKALTRVPAQSWAAALAALAQPPHKL